MADFQELKKTWTSYGKDEPLWSVLTDDKYKGSKNADIFYMSGKQEINNVINLLVNDYNLHLNKETALDFGCGAGRLTRGLSDHFDTVLGVDISEPMIEFAEKHTDENNIRYIVNHKDNLEVINLKVDFIYSRIVLQHMKPLYMFRYLDEFSRILNKGGVMFIPIPTNRDLFAKIKYYIKKIFNIVNDGAMEMYGIEENEMIGWVHGNGIEIVDIVADDSVAGWSSNSYILRKK